MWNLKVNMLGVSVELVIKQSNIKMSRQSRSHIHHRATGLRIAVLSLLLLSAAHVAGDWNEL